MPDRLTTFLTGTAGFSQQEMTRAAAGDAVVKVLSTTDSREVALIGAERVDVPRAFYVAQVAVAVAPSGDSSPARVGVFSDPAAPSDVAGLALPHNEVQDLSRCRPGSCKLKLPGRAIIALRAALDPASPSVDSVASADLGQRMIEYVNAYRTRGNAALVVYADQPQTEAAEQIWDGMLTRSPYVYADIPSVVHYFNAYPHDSLAGAHDAIFWTQDDIPGAKPLITITHQVVYEPPELARTTVIASQQLYCDHYLDGEFDLMAVVDSQRSGADPPQAAYVVFIRRLHFDDLPSGGILDIRGKVTGRFRDETQQELRQTKRETEHAFGTAHSRVK